VHIVLVSKDFREDVFSKEKRFVCIRMRSEIVKKVEGLMKIIERESRR
jgi:hypothetical protein